MCGKLRVQIRLNALTGGGGEYQLRFTLIIHRRLHTNIKATTMQLCVMKFAEFCQILQAGLTPVRPVLYVVGFHMAGLTATRESAGFVPNIQCAPQ
jgi:hypothetical protein